MKIDQTTRCWHFFEKIYCISVNERADRRQEARNQFNRVGLAPRVEFFKVQKHPSNPEEGIFESHLACLRKGLADGATTFLIFEDDILFERFDQRRLDEAIDFLCGRDGWKAFFLGCMVSGRSRNVHPRVVKINYRCLTHAYAVSRGFAESLVSLRWQGIPYDGILREHTHDGFYALFPTCAFQSNSATDNDRLVKLDRFRRRLGGLRRIQKANEFFHFHFMTVIGFHILLIIIVLLWVLT